jgi:hypothetical protein
MTKRRQLTLFDDDGEDDDPRSGEFFTKEALGQWREEPFRKPDALDTGPGYARAIWYGPEGPDGEVATEVVADMDGNTFEVSEYQHVGGLIDEGNYDPDEPFTVQTTKFTLKAVLKALKDAGKKLKRGELVGWAASLGVAQIAYYGGADSWVSELPRIEGGLKGFNGDVIRASRRFAERAVPAGVQVLDDGSWWVGELHTMIVQQEHGHWAVLLHGLRWSPRGGIRTVWRTPYAAYTAFIEAQIQGM